MSVPTIPAIAPYAMPGAAELPPPRAPWQLDPRRATLLIHDMQRYFVDVLPQGASPTVELLDSLARIRRACAAAGIPVVYTAQPGSMTREERGLLVDIWGPGMGSEEAQRQIVPELAPAVGDTVLTKWRYSAFHRSPLEELLREWRRDQLVIGGVYGHVGVLTTALDSFARDIETFVVADAVADFTPEEHRMTLEHAAGRCARVLLTSDVLAALPVPAGAVR